MAEYAICRLVPNIRMVWIVETDISPEQAAAGPMTDGEVAAALIRRYVVQHSESPELVDTMLSLVMWEDDEAMIRAAVELDLWPPEVKA